ncbi:MAG: hypothetical protein SGI72_07655 [Planctomycetota bacterium]|nr:hypothetical protein [Planctomycetota bacterium]
MSEHAELTTERWRDFDRTQQVLQIAAEMHRAKRALCVDRLPSLKLGYERVLRLTDLTVQVQTSLSLRRELLRWRDLIAQLYLQDGPDSETHGLLLRVLLQLDPEASKQVEYLCA